MALDRLTHQILSVQDPNHINTARSIEEALTTILGPCDAQSNLAARASANRPALPIEAVEPMVDPASESIPEVSQALSAVPVPTDDPVLDETPPSKMGLALSPDQARTWSRVFLILVCLVALTLISAVVIGLYNSSQPTDTESSQAPPTTTELTTRPIQKARAFDPKKDGGSGAENNDQVKLSYDNDPTTSWYTEDYEVPLIPDKKPGVGLVFDLGDPVQVSQANLQISLMPVNAMVYIPTDDPATITKAPMSSITKWTPMGGAILTDGTNTINFKPTTTRFVLIYFTKLADLPDGVTQADLAEVTFAG